jgi:hypothetical protein
MCLLRPASDDDMVAVFLAAEVTSERYGPQIRDILTRLVQPLSVVERPDTSDEAASIVRRRTWSPSMGTSGSPGCCARSGCRPN